ncbi:hypothetical protein BDV3_003146 [Batrachochytrium dendrobatidis]
MKANWVWVLLFTIIGLVTAKTRRMTHAEKVALRHASNKADKSIRFIDFDDLQQGVHKQGLYIVFFGAHWFNPKYLSVQERVDKANLKDFDFQMAKVECALDHEVYCHTVHKIEGYPTLLVYVNGTLLHEYPDSDEEEPFYNYILRFIKKYSPKVQDTSTESKDRSHNVPGVEIPTLPDAAPEEDLTKVHKDKGHEGDIDEKDDFIIDSQPMAADQSTISDRPIPPSNMEAELPIVFGQADNARTDRIDSWSTDISVPISFAIMGMLLLYVSIVAFRAFVNRRSKYHRLS